MLALHVPAMLVPHTPAPWCVNGWEIRGVAHPESIDIYEAVATLEPIHREVVTPDGDRVPRKAREAEKANAALIAAAPDLLDALVGVTDALDHALDHALLEKAPLDPRTALDAQEWMRQHLCSTVRRAVAAIAKATGRVPP